MTEANDMLLLRAAREIDKQIEAALKNGADLMILRGASQDEVADFIQEHLALLSAQKREGLSKLKIWLSHNGEGTGVVH